MQKGFETIRKAIGLLTRDDIDVYEVEQIDTRESHTKRVHVLVNDGQKKYWLVLMVRESAQEVSS